MTNHGSARHRMRAYSPVALETARVSRDSSDEESARWSTRRWRRRRPPPESAGDAVLAQAGLDADRATRAGSAARPPTIRPPRAVLPIEPARRARVGLTVDGEEQRRERLAAVRYAPATQPEEGQTAELRRQQPLSIAADDIRVEVRDRGGRSRRHGCSRRPAAARVRRARRIRRTAPTPAAASPPAHDAGDGGAWFGRDDAATSEDAGTASTPSAGK